MSKRNGISRRSFFKTAGVAVGMGSVAGMVPAEQKVSSNSDSLGDLKKRILPGTDLNLSEISMGTGGGPPANVIRYAMSKGLNFIHTSTRYKGGKSIQNVAEAIKGQRDKVNIGLKITWDAEDMDAMDEALAKLGVDQVEIAFFKIHNHKQVDTAAVRRGAKLLKKNGKCKYIGLTTHGEVSECLRVGIDSGIYDVLMPAFTLGSTQKDRGHKGSLKEFKRAAERNMGIVLMKTRHGFDDKTYRKLVSRYLDLPAVGTLNKTMKTFSEVDQMIADSNFVPTSEEKKALDEKVRMAMVGHCSMCGKCTAECPNGLPVSDIVRCSDYYLAHSDYFDVAKENYEFLNGSIADCADCGKCESVCPNGVAVRNHLWRADQILA